MSTLEPAATVLARFGGSGPLAQLLRLDRSTVHRWALPRDRSGSGGLIPARHHQRLLVLAAAEGIPLSAADLVGTPAAVSAETGGRADDG